MSVIEKIMNIFKSKNISTEGNKYSAEDLNKMTKTKLLELSEKQFNSKISSKFKKSELVDHILNIQK